MNRTERPSLARLALVLLMALVGTNATLLILLRTSGPLVGIVFYVILLTRAWHGRRRDYRAAMVGGLVGLAVHAAEVATIGWSAFPMLMALNLILPAILTPVAWLAGGRVRQEDGGK
jgi:hypothetical protein